MKERIQVLLDQLRLQGIMQKRKGRLPTMC